MMPTTRTVDTRLLPLDRTVRWLPLDDPYYMLATVLSSTSRAEQLVVAREALLGVEAHLHEGRTDPCGILVGGAYRCPKHDINYLLVESAERAPAPLGHGLDREAAIAAELSSLRAAVERSGRRVVGWYRGGTTVRPRISVRDVALHHTLFPAAEHVALLREGVGSRRAGAFVRVEPAERRIYSIPFRELLPQRGRGGERANLTAVAWTNYRPEREVVPLADAELARGIEDIQTEPAPSSIFGTLQTLIGRAKQTPEHRTERIAPQQRASLLPPLAGSSPNATGAGTAAGDAHASSVPATALPSAPPIQTEVVVERVPDPSPDPDPLAPELPNADPPAQSATPVPAAVLSDVVPPHASDVEASSATETDGGTDEGLAERFPAAEVLPAEDLAEPAHDLAAAPASEPLAEPAHELAAAPSGEPLAELPARPMSVPMVESLAEAVIEPATEPLPEPPADSVAEPLAEAAAELMVASAVEAAVEKAPGPVPESVREPVAPPASPAPASHAPDMAPPRDIEPDSAAAASSLDIATLFEPATEENPATAPAGRGRRQRAPDPPGVSAPLLAWDPTHRRLRTTGRYAMAAAVLVAVGFAAKAIAARISMSHDERLMVATEPIRPPARRGDPQLVTAPAAGEVARPAPAGADSASSDAAAMSRFALVRIDEATGLLDADLSILTAAIPTTQDPPARAALCAAADSANTRVLMHLEAITLAKSYLQQPLSGARRVRVGTLTARAATASAMLRRACP